MAMRSRGIAFVATVWSLGVALPDQNALADPAVLTLCLRVDDRVAVPDDVLRSAKTVATRIYAKIGVGLVWAVDTSTHGRSDACHGRDAAPSLRIIIVPSGQAEHLDADPKKLGLAAGGKGQYGTVAYVFYDRVRNLSLRYEQHRRGGILGHVVAHEIGHLLLPYGTHSGTGLMRADWSHDDLEHAAHGTLLFSPEEAAYPGTSVASSLAFTSRISS
jgi:hypothetical protein